MADIRARLIEALNGKAPQHKVEGEDRFEASEGSNGSLHVKDKEVLSRLNSLEKKLDSVIENGSVNTQLTGSNVEVLKSYRNNNQYIGGDFYHRWGENDWITLRLIDPVDVSKHPKRMIYIKNDYDVEFNTIRIAFTDIAERTDRGGVILREVELNESIPAGGELLIDESILPLINQPYSGLMVSNLARPVNTVPTTGTHTIIFLGGV